MHEDCSTGQVSLKTLRKIFKDAVSAKNLDIIIQKSLYDSIYLQFAWEKIAIDIFVHRGKSYLCVFDAYSNWLCVEKLQDKSIEHIENKITSQIF